jgi:archaellum component FlaG (FlaF/FlaG flagellin family)
MYPKTYKRGVASIIGGVFIILIILSGYAFYVFSNSVTNDLQSTFKKMSILDDEKNQERLIINNCVSDPSEHTGLVLDVTNSGQNTILIRYIGTLNNEGIDSGVQYNFTDVKLLDETKEYIEPGQSLLYLVPIASFNVEGSYIIKIITERGSIFSVFYSNKYFFDIPSITLSSSSGEQGQPVIISGYNFAHTDDQPGEVYIYIKDIHLTTVTTNIIGSFAVSITPNLDPSDTPYNIVATDHQMRSASAFYKITESSP